MAQIMNEVMDVVHDQSLPTINLLQESFPNNKDFMINVSTLFDPRYVFLVYAPILFAINKRVGHRMVIALTLAEWTNQILKWLLAGERPYWYVHERSNELARLHNASLALNADELTFGHAHRPQPPPLRQFPVTCELGAGSPSGHAMVTATVWYVLIDAYLRGELNLFGRANYGLGGLSAGNKSVAKLGWSLYAIMLVLVSLSRVYLACHFPHQCLCGALLGALLARLVVERAPMEQLRPRHFALATGFMFASALSTYAILRSLGLDPLWSVGKAMRWCEKQEYIHLDTTPFFSMMRYLGFCVGVGLAYDGSKLASSQGVEQAARNSSALGVRRAIAAAASIAFGQFLLSLPAPRANMQLFYATSFLVYVFFGYAIAGPIPRLVKDALQVDTPKSKAKSC